MNVLMSLRGCGGRRVMAGHTGESLYFVEVGFEILVQFYFKLLIMDTEIGFEILIQFYFKPLIMDIGQGKNNIELNR